MDYYKRFTRKSEKLLAIPAPNYGIIDWNSREFNLKKIAILPCGEYKLSIETAHYSSDSFLCFSISYPSSAKSEMTNLTIISIGMVPNFFFFLMFTAHTPFKWYCHGTKKNLIYFGHESQTFHTVCFWFKFS